MSARKKAPPSPPSAQAVVPYKPPPAVARAFEQRGYPPLVLEAYAAARDRAARREALAVEPSVVPPPAPPAAAPPPAGRPAAVQVVGPPRPKPQVMRSRSDVINEVVVKAFDLKTVAKLKAVSRRYYIAHPRQIAIWLHHVLLRSSSPAMTLPAIGRIFSGYGDAPRDHTTILHAIRMVEFRSTLHGDYGDKVREVRALAEAALAQFSIELEKEAAQTREEMSGGATAPMSNAEPRAEPSQGPAPTESPIIKPDR
jgi:hypothetical protein